MARTTRRRSARVKPKASTAATDGNTVYNEILLGLPRKECDAIFTHLELVELRTHDLLHEVGEPIPYCYFVNSGLASILSVTGDGKSVEVGLTGKEGVVGLPLVVGLRTSATRVIVQVAGTAFRLSAANMVPVLRKCSQLEKRLNRYSQELGMQAMQVAACNRLHEVPARLARWLLMSQDRIGGDRVPLTQEFLAHMLGNRRASVTVGAGILQKAGLIKYTRGAVTIVNRPKLEDTACECYRVITRQSRDWRNESS